MTVVAVVAENVDCRANDLVFAAAGINQSRVVVADTLDTLFQGGSSASLQVKRREVFCPVVLLPLSHKIGGARLWIGINEQGLSALAGKQDS